MKGLAWTASETYASAGLGLFFTAWLARILTPADFGIAAAAAVLTMFFMVLTDSVSSTIIQHQHAHAQHVASLFWFCEAVLVGVYVIVFVSAPAIAELTENDAFVSVLRVAALQLPVMGLLMVPLARMRSSLRFRELALCQIVATLIGGIAAVLMAQRGFGYWAIIAQGLIMVALRTVFVGMCDPFRPLLHFNFADARPLLGYAGGLFGFTTVNYWSRNVDILLIGRIMGAHALGHYSLAYRLIGSPMQLVGGMLRPLLHPALVAMDGDAARMRHAYLRLVRSTALITFPAAALLWAAAPVIVRVIWGTGWEPVSNVVRGLALLAAVQPVNSLSAPVYMSCHASRLLFQLSLANAVLLVAGVVAGLPFGIAGVAWSSSIVYAVLVAPLSSGIAHVKLLSGRIADLAAAIVPALMLAVVVIGVALLAGLAP